MDRLCLTLVLLTILSSCSGKPNFMLVGPKVYDTGTNETLVLKFFHVTDNGEVNIRIFNSGGQTLSQTTVDIENGQAKTIQMPAPLIPQNYDRGKLEISGSIGNYIINHTAPIVFRISKPIVFVNTDKPLYKTEQTVKIRILVTDSNLRPSKTAQKGEIWITDPNRIRIAQWLNVSFNQGLLHRELLIPKEPPLGSWTVHVKVNNDHYTSIFEVQEYVLPPFEVTIIPPPYFLKNAKNITWKVCAKYTYGKPVRGQLVAKFSGKIYYYHREVPTIENIKEIDGCQEVIFNITELGERHGYAHTYELIAEVAEEGTGVKMNSSASINPSSYAYTISRRDSDVQYFRPRIPLKMIMEVKTPALESLTNELINVCLKIKREIWNEMRSTIDNLNVCKNYTSNQHGYVIFTVPPQDSHTVSIEVKVEAADRYFHSKDRLQVPSNTFQLKPWYSPSGSHLQIERLPKVDCSAFRSDVQITQPFHYTFNEPGARKFYYQVMTRGEIVRSGDFDVELSVNDDENSTDETYLPYYSSSICIGDGFKWGKEVNSSKHTGKLFFPIELTHEMIPKVRLLLYTVTDDEIVADSIWYDTDPCFANQVLMSFGEKEQLPASKASIHLRAEPQSLCSVGVVDKSVYILNKGDLLTGSKISDRLRDFETPSFALPSQRTADYFYCSKKEGNAGHTLTASHVADAITAFESGGWVVLTDLKLETRPCKKLERSNCFYPEYTGYPPPPGPVGFPGHGSGFSRHPQNEIGVTIREQHTTEKDAQSVSTPSVTVRTEFPETWLFDLYTIGEEGKLIVTQNLPDSITEWQGAAICVHPDKGLGLSKPASIVAFQPFFVSLTLPYSVIRNETIPVIVSVFNYLKACLAIKLHLDKTEDFVLFNGTLSKDICVCGEDAITARFHIKPTALGQVNITVMAATSKKHEVCGNLEIATNVKRSDTIIKPILVEAEGFLKEETTTTFFCMKDFDSGIFSTEHVLQLPTNIVKDSARGFCFFTGDIMGPTLEGLDRLIRLPTGCGEQNMIGLVPNIVVLDYLNATGRLTEKLKQQALNNIMQGYIREQKFRHRDGSYSAFGTSDKEGSMWLTAFVVRTFASARRHINIDEESLKYSRNWILSRQGSNGCFPMIGTLHHQEMKGGVANDDITTSTLTAYILISMLESGQMEGSKIVSGLQCLEAKNKPTNYSLALFSYAASLAGDPYAITYLQHLIENAERESSYIYWKEADKSISIETAGYAILTLLQLNRKDDFQNAAAIARWLTEQRNPYGGFYSTQDTVVALQALGEYGARINRQELNMELSIQFDQIEERYQLNEDNELLTRRVDLRLGHPKTDIHITASGTGCALVQTLLRYNLPIPEPSKDFQLSVKAQKSKEDCKKAEIHVCLSYNHPNGSNMAIVEIRIVSGYVPVKNSVSKLLQKTELEVRRYEIVESNVNIYFTTLTKETRCFSFEVIQEIEILDAKPANAKVYDYYDNEKVVSVPYSIEEQCAL